MLLATGVIVSLVLGLAQETVQVQVPTSAQAQAPDMAAFDEGMAAGQAYYVAGDYLSAARTWYAVGKLLTPTAEQRGNVVAVHGYVADAYDQAAQRTMDPAVLREALAVLDEHAAQFVAAYPDAPPMLRTEQTRERLRGRLVALDAVYGAPEPAPVERVPVVVKPWRPLAFGGGAALAGGVAMMAVFTVGLVRTKQFEDGGQAAAVQCQINTSDAPCGQDYDHYRAASTMQLTGMVLGPVLLGAGAAMLTMAIKRKRAAEHTQVLPMFSRGLFGLGVQRRF